MLHKCANPACPNVFRRLSEGRLFQVQTEYLAGTPDPATRSPKDGRRVEYFWLCQPCSAFLTLAFDRTRGMVTVPVPEAAGRKTVTSIRLIPREHRMGGVVR